MWPIKGRIKTLDMRPSDFSTILCAFGSCVCVYSALHCLEALHQIPNSTSSMTFFPFPFLCPTQGR